MKFDQHDRVNYASQHSFVRVDGEVVMTDHAAGELAHRKAEEPMRALRREIDLHAGGGPGRIHHDRTRIEPRREA